MKTKRPMREKKKYKVEVDKKYKGFDYLVIGLTMGHRCGYVRIPIGHKLYGLSYSEQIPISFKEISEGKIGKRGVLSIFCASKLKPDDNISMGLLFDVHGGITYSRKRVANKNGWWIGFDCAHFGDRKDISLMDKKYKEMNERYYLSFSGDIVRTKEYVESECKSLIDQIIKWF